MLTTPYPAVPQSRRAISACGLLCPVRRHRGSLHRQDHIALDNTSKLFDDDGLLIDVAPRAVDAGVILYTATARARRVPDG
jgi:hypothetical protein